MSPMMMGIYPGLALVLAGLLGLIIKAHPRLPSVMQHLAAGIIFGAVAVELLPLVIDAHEPWRMAVGFILGVGAMLMVKMWAGHEGHHDDKETAKGLSLVLLIGLGVDLTIDGLLVGIAQVAGQEQGLLMMLAISFEVVIIGLTLATQMRALAMNTMKKLGLFVGLGLLIPIGVVIGKMVALMLPENWQVSFIAFGIAALLYLVTEELLTEAHQSPDTPWETSLFFVGFLAMMLLEVN